MLMDQVNESSKINESTLAIREARVLGFQTEIISMQGTEFSVVPPLKLLDDRCIQAGFTMQGNIKATRIRHRIHNKVPLVVDPFRNMIAMPTHSPKHIDNVWIFSEHILATHPHTKTQSIVEFTNNQSLILNCSIHTLDKQYNRTCRLSAESMYRNKQYYMMNYHFNRDKK
ncbi:competence protein ComK [Jeotgalibacillus salarius]|uniref:Competence protein n=1 Tax=Jeotgalibacillus salarius TaxID=546023 RepID=A0A4Y8LNR9_9BACL|nr:competence protein ComK [Jeotgalibacillus salarius]TFE04057.1 hypothetical protein E2626_01640 [Jeotgalibacillus salarius]